MNVGIITMEKAGNRPDNSVGSSRIRGKWVWKHWPEAEEWRVGRKYDVIIFQKVYWDEMLDNYGGIKILDMCDPDWLERKDIMKYVDKVDAVTTSTEALAEYIRKFFPNKIIRCIPDRIDLEEHQNIKTKHSDHLEKLVWFGYAHNFEYIQDILENSKGREIFRENNLSLTVYTDSQIHISNKAMSDVKFVWKKYEYSRMHEELIKYDAAFFPSSRSQTSERNKYKSNNKLLTCMALGLPIITEPEDIKPLFSQKAREDVATKNLAEIKEKWDVNISVSEYKALISEIMLSKSNNVSVSIESAE